MRTILQKKTVAFTAILSFFLLTILFISCKKDMHSDTSTVPDQVADLSTKINSSVSGFVTDENNAPVSGASVQVGTVSTITDQFGFFEVKNVEVVKTAAVVTIIKSGYFKGIKTWAATENKAAFFRIKLLPKTIAGTINSSAGGNVTLSSGLIIALPSDAVVVASNNTAYTGDINVAVQWINPESAELNKIMPGDLRGIDERSFIKGLTTFGMAAVELTGASGELLQIATGKKATITMPLSATLSAAAPSSIPLWYFDESNGLWKEQGAAAKTGNAYVGDVSHFSFWNCDVPSSYIQLQCTIVDGNGNPLSYIVVKLTQANNLALVNSTIGITDATGFVSGIVPANAQLLLEVLSGINCSGNSAVYSQNITTSTTNLSLGNITVNASNAIAGVSGTVTDCNNNSVTNGSIYMNDGAQNYYYPVNNGAYNFNTLVCANASTTISIVVQDNDALQQSASQSVIIVAGPNVIPAIQACGTQLLNYISNGYVYHPTAPRSIDNFPKQLTVVNNTSVSCFMGDLGAQNYVAIFDVDPATHHITITAAPGASGGAYYQWDNGLPTTAPGPGYTPQWAGSPQCNNTYDPITHTYYVRYGYIGGTGYRVIEEILTPQ